MPISDHLLPPKSTPNFLFIFLKFTIMFFIFSSFLIFLTLTAILLLTILIADSFFNRRRRHHPTTHLPVFLYSGSIISDDQCSICLEGFKEGEFCSLLPVCDHFFHAKCVDLWLREVMNCPVCRGPVRVDGDGMHGSMIESDDDDGRRITSCVVNPF